MSPKQIVEETASEWSESEARTRARGGFDSEMITVNSSHGYAEANYMPVVRVKLQLVQLARQSGRLVPWFWQQTTEAYKRCFYLDI